MNDSIISMITNSINSMEKTIDDLIYVKDSNTKRKLINRLKNQVSNIKLMATELQTLSSTINLQMGMDNPQRLSRTELEKYTGKDSMPAYIAVDNVIYDVSNVSAWGGATHFGLSAGQDVTAQFNSCHGGQSILQKLPIVGEVAND